MSVENTALDEESVDREEFLYSVDILLPARYKRAFSMIVIISIDVFQNSAYYCPGVEVAR